MAEYDIESTISDVKLFLEKLKSDLPEVFTPKPTEQKQGTNLEDNSVNISQEQIQNSAGKVLYQGNLFDSEITINSNLQKPSVLLLEDKFHIILTSAKDNPNICIEDFLRQRAKDILTERVKYWANQMGVIFNNIFVKDQKSLWASCSEKKNLNFSYRIIKMPKIVADYLIIHELAHLIHFDHSAEFWALVEQFMPDYKQHRKWLNNNRYAVMAESKLKYIPKMDDKENK